MNTIPADCRLRFPGGFVMKWTVSSCAIALATVLVLAGTGPSMAGKYGNHGGKDAVVWFLLGSALTLLTTKSYREKPHRRGYSRDYHRLDHVHHQRHRGKRNDFHRKRRHDHYPGWRRGHRHGFHGHPGPKHGRQSLRPDRITIYERHVRIPQPPVIYSDEHRHGNGPWHVHPLSHRRAAHSHR